MTEIAALQPGEPAGNGGVAPSRKPIAAALAAVAAALVPALGLWGFTVDDALISARVASHLAAGQGYRFNSSGPVTDAVTPLGFAHVLAAFGPAEPLAMLERARVLGLVAWLLAAGYLGWLLRRVGRSAFVAALVLLATSAPLGAWAGSGMETGLVVALATFALAPARVAFLAAGVAAGFRPELLPWAVVLCTGRALLNEVPRGGALLWALTAAVGPALVIALTRQHYFHDPAPLAVSAKPSDLGHGFQYALAAFVLGGAPLALLAPRALASADRDTKVLVLAALAHFGALLLAGGDWMALYRLLVPVLPSIVLAAARLADHAPARTTWLRLLVATAASLLTVVSTGLPGRGVALHRRSLIERARAPLAGAKTVATIDAGWVGAATAETVLDLAGVTDPVVARLPGGHTTKRIPEELLRARGADAWVLLLAPGAALEEPWQTSVFARGVEQRLARLDLSSDFEVRATLRLGGTRQSYVVLRLKRSLVAPDRAPATPP